MLKRRVITIDIETLPIAEPIEILLTGKEKSDEQKAQEAYRKTALNGDFGRILCIGYCDEKPNGTRRIQTSSCGLSEGKMSPSMPRAWPAA